MKNHKRGAHVIGAAAALLLAWPLAANAQLTVVTQNGGRMITDGALNVTWADVASPADLTFGYGNSTAAWLASLNTQVNANGTLGYGGYTDWVLPTGDGYYTQPQGDCATSLPGTGAGCGASTSRIQNQLGYLFINELGNTAGAAVTNTSPFTTLSTSSECYLVSTTYVAFPGGDWCFLNIGGFEIPSGKLEIASGAIAMRYGQVATLAQTAPLLWNEGGGRTALWFFNAGALASTVNLREVPASWTPLAEADFTGVGKPDILWRDSSGGDVVLWWMDGGNIASTLDLGVAPSSWTFAGAVGSARPYVNYEGAVGDILWRHSNGELVMWTITHGALAGSTYLGVLPASWTVAGTGDFNDDGNPDILWRNSNGEVVIWFLNGSNAVASRASLGVVPLSSTIQAVGDFSGAGYSDILWRDANGDVQIWFMNGSTVTAKSDLGAVPTTWIPQVTRDFNGDGKTDILWRDTRNGEAVIWFMNGATYTTSRTFDNLGGWTAIQ